MAHHVFNTRSREIYWKDRTVFFSNDCFRAWGWIPLAAGDLQREPVGRRWKRRSERRVIGGWPRAGYARFHGPEGHSRRSRWGARVTARWTEATASRGSSGRALGTPRRTSQGRSLCRRCSCPSCCKLSPLILTGPPGVTFRSMKTSVASSRPATNTLDARTCVSTACPRVLFVGHDCQGAPSPGPKTGRRRAEPYGPSSRSPSTWC